MSPLCSIMLLIFKGKGFASTVNVKNINPTQKAEHLATQLSTKLSDKTLNAEEEANFFFKNFGIGTLGHLIKDATIAFDFDPAIVKV